MTPSPARPPAAHRSAALPQVRTLDRRLLTSAEFSKLKDVPPEAEWFANLESPGTRRIYKVDLRDFMKYTGIQQPRPGVAVQRGRGARQGNGRGSAHPLG